jgi:hypothetical protein
MTMTTTHTCHAHGCKVPVAESMLMCRAHWWSVPKKTRDAIWREYRQGQEIAKTPSLRYLAVQRLAVGQAVFKPHDEDAAKIAAGYIAEAGKYCLLAMAAGKGNPLKGLVPDESWLASDLPKPEKVSSDIEKTGRASLAGMLRESLQSPTAPDVEGSVTPPTSEAEAQPPGEK